MNALRATARGAYLPRQPVNIIIGPKIGQGISMRHFH